MASLSLKVRFLRAELQEWNDRKLPGWEKATIDLGTWKEVARYLFPEIVLRLSKDGTDIHWIHAPELGIIPPQLQELDGWIQTLSQSEEEPAIDAIASLRRTVFALDPDAKRKNALKLLSALERLVRA